MKRLQWTCHRDLNPIGINLLPQDHTSWPLTPGPHVVLVWEQNSVTGPVTHSSITYMIVQLLKWIHLWSWKIYLQLFMDSLHILMNNREREMEWEKETMLKFWSFGPLWKCNRPLLFWEEIHTARRVASYISVTINTYCPYSFSMDNTPNMVDYGMKNRE